MILRTLTESINRVSQAFPVVAILGPRQSGKTTLAKTIFNKHKYISFEEVIEARNEFKNDPHGFFNTYKNEHGIILDEFQHVPDILSYIQLYVDLDRKPGYFILTGSQNFLMNTAITQTLAGRVAIMTLLPLSIGELLNANLLPNNIEELVFKGSYPELFVNPKLLSTDWYPNYIRTYLERDVRDVKRVENLSTFNKFMKLCAARIGQVLNHTSLANDCDISVPTVKAWLSVLEASYVIFTLQPYSSKFTRRLIKSPKLFFYDVGLASSLLGLESVEDVKLSIYRGNLIESLIISEIMKLYLNYSRVPRAFFLRDKTGHEIDCVLEKHTKLIPIEIKSKMTASMNLFDDLVFWKKVAEKEEDDSLADGYVIYSGQETQKRSYGTFLSWKDINKLLDVI
jgi:predicted AAA+ superfamily ATPase